MNNSNDLSENSLKITELKANQLKELFPEIFTENKIDLEKLKKSIGQEHFAAKERYHLDWAGKNEAYKILQQSTTATLMPEPEKSINFDTSENVFIEGENLEVLKVLQKSYFDKVKMIYIDPPYNTGNDSFIYPDKFSETKEEYLKRIDNLTDDGYLMKEGLLRKNAKENGQYHSNWLSMILPRLYLARNLLKDNGIIFVSIDDNEVHNLRLIMNEIFGEENFITQIVWRRTDNQANIGIFAKVKEYILCFAKNINAVSLSKMNLSDRAVKEYRYSDNKGKFRRDILLHKTRGRHTFEVITKSGKSLNGPWMLSEEKFKEKDNNGGIYWTSGGDEQPYGKIYLDNSEGQIPNDFWGIEFGTNQEGSLDLDELFNIRYFDFPKPKTLLKTLITIGSKSDSNDIILDFFAGSGTIAHSIFELNQDDDGNRKYICVQLPENTDTESEAYKAGYKTISDICRERIKRVINNINQEKEELGKETAILMEQVIQLQQEIEEEKDKLIKNLQLFKDEIISPEIEKLIKKQETTKNKAHENIAKIDKIVLCDLGFKSFKLVPSNFKQWRSDLIDNIEDINQMQSLFETPQKTLSKDFLIFWELLIKSGYDLITKYEIVNFNNHLVYKIDSNYFIINSIDEQAIDEILKLKPHQIIALDSIFQGQDSLKTNIAEQCRQSEGNRIRTVFICI